MVEVHQQCVRSGIEKTVTEISFTCVLHLSEFSPGGTYFPR